MILGRSQRYLSIERGHRHFTSFRETLHASTNLAFAPEGKERIAGNRLELDLEHSLLGSEMIPFYQPIVRLSDRAVIGHEALLRWASKHGLRTPPHFLKAAEELGLIEAIDWTIFAATLRDAHLLGGNYVSINVSPRHFLQSNLDRRLLALIDASGTSADRIRIELTEDTLIDNPAQVVDILDKLRERGVASMIDDFGTGFSSLSYAYRLPVKALKLDRSIVMDLCTDRWRGSIAVARAVLSLARDLGLEVVAEGIENEAQLGVLQELGCMHGQGFLLGRPAPVSRIADLEISPCGRQLQNHAELPS